MGTHAVSERGQLEADIVMAREDVKIAERKLASAKQRLIDYDAETERRAAEKAAKKAEMEARHARHADRGV